MNGGQPLPGMRLCVGLPCNEAVSYKQILFRRCAVLCLIDNMTVLAKAFWSFGMFRATLTPSANKDRLATACQPEAGVKDEASWDDYLPVVSRALIAHPPRHMRCEEAPLVPYAMRCCCTHEQSMLIFCPISHGLHAHSS